MMKLKSSPLVGLLVATTFLSACSVGPNYTRPDLGLPSLWSNASRADTQPALLANWWKTFNDPTLDMLVERAMAEGLTVAAAQARVLEARATLGQANGALAPSLDASVGAQRQKTAETASVSGTSTIGDAYPTSLQSSWEIDLFGGKRRAREAARYGLNSAEEDLRDTRLVLLSDVVTYYANLRAAQASLALARRTAASQRETAQLTQVLVESGSSNSADLSRAQALAATTEADIPTYEIQRAEALHRLGVLLGRAPAELAPVLERTRPLPQPRFPMPAGIPAQVLVTRPDVRMAELALAQATANVGVAEAARYPAISLAGSITSQALSVSDVGAGSTIGWSIGPSVTLPLFSGGTLKAAVAAAGARRQAAFVAYHQSVLTAMEEVENGLVATNQNRQRTSRLQSAVTGYRDAADAARIEYEAGSRSYIDLLTDQRSLYAAEASLIQSRLDTTLAYIALNKALGGGWTGGAPTN